jgi:membrane-associated phospholipid phosphatase
MELKSWAKRTGEGALILLWIGSLWEYGVIDRPLGGAAHLLRTPLDDLIPLWTPIVLPYLFFYVYLVGTLVWSWLRDKRVFLAFTVAGILAFQIANLLFILFPTEVIRPTELGAGWTSQLLADTYAALPPRNTFPSEHTIGSVLCALAWCSLRSRLAPYAVVLSAVIVSATVLLKQHYLPDLLAGGLVAVICYFSVCGFGAFWHQTAKH